MVKNKFITKEDCRLCFSKNIKACFSLPETPLANEFIKIKKKQCNFPLELNLCNDCGHLQLKHVVDPKILFENYVYVSGTSKKFLKHFKDYTKLVIKKSGMNLSSLIVEIGSNDGTMLQNFYDLGYKNIIGIDPAIKIAKKSNLKGIKTLNTFFTKTLAAKISRSNGKADIIIANNVLAHIDDLHNIFEGVKNLISKEGIFCFEVSYLLDVIEKKLFDTIYHEHISYHTVKPLFQFVENKGMYLYDAQKVDSHGGSIRCFVSNKRKKIKQSVNNLINQEIERSLFQVSTYHIFHNQIRVQGIRLNNLLHKFNKDKKRIAGFGAPAKLTTLMYTFKLDSKLFEFIIDDSPWKQGLLTPGLNIKVVSSKYLDINKVDVCVVFAWNFFQEIKNKHYRWVKSGGVFINPLDVKNIYKL